MKYKLIFCFALISFVAASCAGNSNTSAGRNINSIVNAANANSNSSAVATNINAATATPSPIVPSTEVPTYETAQSALDAGKKFFDADEDEKAVKAFEQSVKLDPNLPEAQFELAVAYDAVENKESAEKAYNAAIKSYLKFLVKNPKDATAQFNLGRSYNKINEDEKAQKALQQAVKLSPDDSEFHFELGSILIKLAKYSEAVKELKKSLELDPENARAEVALEKAESGDDRVKAAQAKSKDSKEVKISPARNPAPVSKQKASPTPQASPQLSTNTNTH